MTTNPLSPDAQAVVEQIKRELDEGVRPGRPRLRVAFIGPSRVGKTTMLLTMLSVFLQRFRTGREQTAGDFPRLELKPEDHQPTAAISNDALLNRLRAKLARFTSPDEDLPRELFDEAVRPSKTLSYYRYRFNVVNGVGTEIPIRMADMPGSWFNNVNGWEWEATAALCELCDVLVVPVDVPALMSGNRDIMEMRNAPTALRSLFQYLSARDVRGDAGGWLVIFVPLRCERWRWADHPDAQGDPDWSAKQSRRMFEEVDRAYADVVSVIREKWSDSKFAVTPVETLGSVHHHHFENDDDGFHSVFRKKAADASVEGVDTDQPVLHMITRLLAEQELNRPRLFQQGCVHNWFYGVRGDIRRAAELVRRRTKGIDGGPADDGFGYL
ncbi:hypothetical protein ACFVHB_36145 [Kitasatospora sp. NPDC127111]|uniref:hypothetical protein n=1 Tax=Kitasatospora sp. NPDC127111 TaxID=3345363 RepID=UPI00363D23F3